MCDSERSMQEENEYLKKEVERLIRENEELEVIKSKWLKHVDYRIKIMTENMKEGEYKEECIKMLMKQFF